MIPWSLITTPVKQAIYFSGHVRSKMNSHDIGSRLPSHKICVRANEFQPKKLAFCISRRSFSISSTGYQVFQQCFSKQRSDSNTMRNVKHRTKRFGISLPFPNTKLRIASFNKDMITRIKWSSRSSRLLGGASPGILLGLSVFFSRSKALYAEADSGQNSEEKGSIPGKQVYTNYSITGIPGDGRCLFRSVAHGACLRAGKPSPSEGLQRELADELRASVADEFIKRREETEWFVEGDFDSYVSQMRKPHVWGGEPELFMASHVLQMPITVYMYDENAGGLISIAEYGQEYGKENPIRVLYHGFGHYDSLQIPGKSNRSKL